jgi:hypothetical protein
MSQTAPPLRLGFWLVLPPIVALCTYYFWWHPRLVEEIEPRPLTIMLVLYWASIVAALLVAYLYRRRLTVAIAVVVVTALILYPPSQTALTLSLWVVNGTAW